MDTPAHEQTAPQVAEELGYSEERIRQLLRAGQLKGHKVGGRWRIPRSAVDAFLHPERSDVSPDRSEPPLTEQLDGADESDLLDVVQHRREMLVLTERLRESIVIPRPDHRLAPEPIAVEAYFIRSGRTNGETWEWDSRRALPTLKIESSAEFPLLREHLAGDSVLELIDEMCVALKEYVQSRERTVEQICAEAEERLGLPTVLADPHRVQGGALTEEFSATVFEEAIIQTSGLKSTRTEGYFYDESRGQTPAHANPFSTGTNHQVTYGSRTIAWVEHQPDDFLTPMSEKFSRRISRPHARLIEDYVGDERIQAILESYEAMSSLAGQIRTRLSNGNMRRLLRVTSCEACS